MAMLLLMGGKSSRMGTSKALLTYQGRTFFDRIAEEMAACGPLTVSVDKKEHVPTDAYPIVEDVWPEIGPLGGIASAMRRIPQEHIFVCACDMPFMNREYIRSLGALLTPQTAGIAVRADDGRLHMTGAVYSRQMLAAFERRIESGDYALRKAFCSFPVEIREARDIPGAREALRNVNTPQEYEKLLLQ